MPALEWQLQRPQPRPCECGPGVSQQDFCNRLPTLQSLLLFNPSFCSVPLPLQSPFHGATRFCHTQLGLFLSCLKALLDKLTSAYFLDTRPQRLFLQTDFLQLLRHARTFQASVPFGWDAFHPVTCLPQLCRELEVFLKLRGLTSLYPLILITGSQRLEMQLVGLHPRSPGQKPWVLGPLICA